MVDKILMNTDFEQSEQAVLTKYLDESRQKVTGFAEEANKAASDLAEQKMLLDKLEQD